LERIAAEHLVEMMPDNLSYERAQWILPHLEAALVEFEINTKARIAMFLANIAVETGELQWFQELDNLEGTYLINQAYYPYYGRGLIHLTWEDNYGLASYFLGEDLVNNPDRAKEVDVACRIGGWFWTQRGNNLYFEQDGRWPVDLNEFADVGDFDATCYGVNGGWNGYDERVWYYNQALGVLPENLGVGGDLMFEKYNLVAAVDAPWDRAVAYAAGAALNAEGIPSLVLTAPENIQAASLAAYRGEVGQYSCLVVGSTAHDHLDPIDQEFDRWEEGVDTWKCWTDDRSDEGTLRTLRNNALAYIAEREGKPDLIERFDKVLRAIDPRFDGALNNL